MTQMEVIEKVVRESVETFEKKKSHALSFGTGGFDLETFSEAMDKFKEETCGGDLSSFIIQNLRKALLPEQ